jgi:hypothetical protein
MNNYGITATTGLLGRCGVPLFAAGAADKQADSSLAKGITASALSLEVDLFHVVEDRLGLTMAS